MKAHTNAHTRLGSDLQVFTYPRADLSKVCQEYRTAKTKNPKHRVLGVRCSGSKVDKTFRVNESQIRVGQI